MAYIQELETLDIRYMYTFLLYALYMYISRSLQANQGCKYLFTLERADVGQGHHFLVQLTEEEGCRSNPDVQTILF